MPNVTDFLIGLDVSIYRAINDLCGLNPTLDRIAVHAQIIQGTIFVGIVGALWFWPEDRKRRRETIIIMILAIAVSLILNRTVSTLLPFRDRPMYALGARAPSFPWQADLRALEQLSQRHACAAVCDRRWFLARFKMVGPGLRGFRAVHLTRSGISRHPLSFRHFSRCDARNCDKHCAGSRLRQAQDRGAYPRDRDVLSALFLWSVLCELSELADGFPVTRRIAVAVVHLFRGYSR